MIGNRIDSPLAPTTTVGADESDQRATARQLARDLAHTDIDTLARHQLVLAAAVAELTVAAGRPWRITPDEAVVALVRAVVKLSLMAPTAASVHAGRLRRLLAAGA